MTNEIKLYCYKHCITLSELADRLGVSISYLSKIGRKQLRPNIETKEKLRALGIDINQEDINAYNNRKNEKIRELLEENRVLKEKVKLLEKTILEKINNTCDKLLKVKNNDR